VIRRLIVAAGLTLVVCAHLRAHDVSATPITWNREISRIFYERCVSCHRPGGTSFSLMTYPEVQPRAVAIRDAVLSRRMPPWGAVKGFGDFRDDQGLSQAELELITDWIDSDTPKGNNPNVLPKEPKFEKYSVYKLPKSALTLSGDLTLKQDLTVGGLLPIKAASAKSMKIVAVLPDGETKPLLWLYEYDDRYRHPFLFRDALDLPAGTLIRGVSGDSQIALLPGKKGRKTN